MLKKARRPLHLRVEKDHPVANEERHFERERERFTKERRESPEILVKPSVTIARIVTKETAAMRVRMKRTAKRKARRWELKEE